MGIEEFWKSARIRVSDVLEDKFGWNDIQTLCFDLGIEFEDIAGDTKSTKVISLLKHVYNQDLILPLIEAMAKERPKNQDIQDLLRVVKAVTTEPQPERPGTPTPDGRGTGDDTQNDAQTLGKIKKRWALLVGINEFDDAAHYHSLKFCEKDADDMEQRLASLGYVCTKLTRKQASPSLQPTRRNILVQIKRIRDIAAPGDLILLHFATHGVRSVDGKAAWLIASDTDSSSEMNPETKLTEFESTALSVDRIINTLKQGKSKRLVLLLDACHIGEDRDPTELEEQRKFREYVNDRAQGMGLLAASAADQTAKEIHQNGLFTEFVLNGLSGNADRTHKGYVTVADLADYVLFRTQEFYDHAGKSRQDPTRRIDGIGDMVVAELPAMPVPSPAAAPVGAIAEREPQPAPIAAQPMEIQKDRVRALLGDALDLRTAKNIAEDYFAKVYEDIGDAGKMSDYVDGLIRYCFRMGEVEKLLKLVKEKNPVEFAKSGIVLPPGA